MSCEVCVNDLACCVYLVLVETDSSDFRMWRVSCVVILVWILSSQVVGLVHHTANSEVVCTANQQVDFCT